MYDIYKAGVTTLVVILVLVAILCLTACDPLKSMSGSIKVSDVKSPSGVPCVVAHSSEGLALSCNWGLK